MADLTFEQLEFLEENYISLSRVFDATGLSRQQYREQMRDLEMVVAIGVTPCKSAAHTLRTRAGHCAQCRPQNLMFQLRYEYRSYLYVSHSSLGRVVKVGIAKDPQRRKESLIYSGYGGYDDWEIKYTYECDKAGRIEYFVQQELKNFRTIKFYKKEGRTVVCRELFKCSVSRALKAFKKVMNTY